jgi:vacuolar-type H+-ATPase subunit F/Vma7
MLRPLFIGDRVSAAGFRLGGAMVEVPEPGAELQVFRRALETSDLILVSAEIAARLPGPLLEDVQAAGKPLVLVIPDVRGLHQPADIAATLRRQLGMAE